MERDHIASVAPLFGVFWVFVVLFLCSRKVGYITVTKEGKRYLECDHIVFVASKFSVFLGISCFESLLLVRWAISR